MSNISSVNPEETLLVLEMEIIVMLLIISKFLPAPKFFRLTWNGLNPWIIWRNAKNKKDRDFWLNIWLKHFLKQSAYIYMNEEMYTEEINSEIRNRIRVALAALAYEKYDSPIMTDAEFDTLARQINLKIKTRRPDLDIWFEKNFEPNTGSWVWAHPGIDRLSGILESAFHKKLED